MARFALLTLAASFESQNKWAREQVPLGDRGGAEQPWCPDQRDVIVRDTGVHENYRRAAERVFDLGNCGIGHGFHDVHA